MTLVLRVTHDLDESILCGQGLEVRKETAVIQTLESKSVVSRIDRTGN